MSNYKCIAYAWENITKKYEEIQNKEIDRQRRLIIAEQVERTQRLGRIKMTKHIHLYEFEKGKNKIDKQNHFFFLFFLPTNNFF